MDSRLSKTLVLVLALSLAVFAFGCAAEAPMDDMAKEPAAEAPAEESSEQTPVEEADTSEEGSEEEPAAEESTTEADAAEVKTIVVTGENYKFMVDGEENPDITVNVGDTVRVEFTSTEGFHDWVVDEFDAATEKVSSGGTTSVEFVADTAGTFEYYCSVGSHRAQGMVGNLIVE